MGKWLPDEIIQMDEFLSEDLKDLRDYVKDNRGIDISVDLHVLEQRFLFSLYPYSEGYKITWKTISNFEDCPNMKKIETEIRNVKKYFLKGWLELQLWICGDQKEQIVFKPQKKYYNTTFLFDESDDLSFYAFDKFYKDFKSNNYTRKYLKPKKSKNLDNNNWQVFVTELLHEYYSDREAIDSNNNAVLHIMKKLCFSKKHEAFHAAIANFISMQLYLYVINNNKGSNMGIYDGNNYINKVKKMQQRAYNDHVDIDETIVNILKKITENPRISSLVESEKKLIEKKIQESPKIKLEFRKAQLKYFSNQRREYLNNQHKVIMLQKQMVSTVKSFIINLADHIKSKCKLFYEFIFHFFQYDNFAFAEAKSFSHYKNRFLKHSNKWIYIFILLFSGIIFEYNIAVKHLKIDNEALRILHTSYYDLTRVSNYYHDNNIKALNYEEYMLAKKEKTINEIKHNFRILYAGIPMISTLDINDMEVFEKFQNSKKLSNDYKQLLEQWAYIIVLRSDLFLHAGKIDDAIKMIELYLKKQQADNKIIDSYFEKNRNKIKQFYYALGELWKLSANNSINTDAFKEKHRNAIAVYLSMIDIFGEDDPRPYHYAGYHYYEIGEFKNSLKMYQKAIHISDDYAKVYFNISMLLKEHPELDNSLNYLDEFNKAKSLTEYYWEKNEKQSYLNKGECDPRVSYTLAIIYAIEKDYQQCLKFLKITLQVDIWYSVRAKT